MKRGTFNFIQWVASLISTTLLIFAIIYGPSHYREEGEKIAKKKYQFQIDKLTLEVIAAEVRSKKDSLDASIAYIERDSATARNARCDQHRVSLQKRNELLQLEIDSLTILTEAYYLDQQNLEQQFNDSIKILTAVRHKNKQKDDVLQKQSLRYQQLSSTVDSMSRDVAKANTVLKQHFSFRFCFLALLLINSIIIFAIYKNWINLNFLIRVKARNEIPDEVHQAKEIEELLKF